MIKRKQRIPMRDLGRLSGEDADTAAKNRVGGRDLTRGLVVGCAGTQSTPSSRTHAPPKRAASRRCG